MTKISDCLTEEERKFAITFLEQGGDGPHWDDRGWQIYRSLLKKLKEE